VQEAPGGVCKTSVEQRDVVDPPGNRACRFRSRSKNARAAVPSKKDQGNGGLCPGHKSRPSCPFFFAMVPCSVTARAVAATTFRDGNRPAGARASAAESAVVHLPPL